MDQESLAQIQQLIAAATDTLHGELVDSKRHAGILAEGLRHELQLVAEGFQLHLDRRQAEGRSFLEEQFRETRALIHISYSQIQATSAALDRSLHAG